MNDQLILENYLLVLKSTVEVYVHGTLEAANSQIKSLLKNCLNDTLTSQASTYDLMTRYGWYQVNNVNQNTINETLNTINNN